MTNGKSAISMESLMAVKEGNGDILGKLLYFSLGNILVDKEAFRNICQTFGYVCEVSRRHMPGADAFRSATGDISARLTDGGNICKVYFRDNRKDGKTLSRELIKETLGMNTNQYAKLANVTYDVDQDLFSQENLNYYDSVDPAPFCGEAASLFELYKKCANRSHVEKVIGGCLDRMEATPISIHGRLFFVPYTHMQHVDAFESFLEELNAHNVNSAVGKNGKPLVANSLYVADDAKQREKMTEEFLMAARKELEAYQGMCEHLIQSDSQSVAVMSRYIQKYDRLIQRVKNYEDVLHRRMAGLQTDISSLGGYVQELHARCRRIELAKSSKTRQCA